MAFAFTIKAPVANRFEDTKGPDQNQKNKHRPEISDDRYSNDRDEKNPQKKLSHDMIPLRYRDSLTPQTLRKG